MRVDSYLSKPLSILCNAVMSITVAIMSLAFERLWVVIPGSPYFDSLESLGFTLLIMLCGGVIAFFMVWTEFAVIANTSALTFMIAGTFKELVTGASHTNSSLRKPPGSKAVCV